MLCGIYPGEEYEASFSYDTPFAFKLKEMVLYNAASREKIKHGVTDKICRYIADGING